LLTLMTLVRRLKGELTDISLIFSHVNKLSFMSLPDLYDCISVI
jgi:hypothetical protein